MIDRTSPVPVALRRAVSEVELGRRRSVATPDPVMILGLAREPEPTPARVANAGVAGARSRDLVGALSFAVALVRAQTVIFPAIAWVLVAVVTGLGLVASTAVQGQARILFVGALQASDVIALAAVAAVVALSVLASPADAHLDWIRASAAGPTAVLAARLTLVLGCALGLAIVSEFLAAAMGVSGAGFSSVLAWVGPAFLSCAVVTLVGLYTGAVGATSIGVVTLWVFARVLAAGPEPAGLSLSLGLFAAGVAGVVAVLMLASGFRHGGLAGALQ